MRFIENATKDAKKDREQKKKNSDSESLLFLKKTVPIFMLVEAKIIEYAAFDIVTSLKESNLLHDQ